LQSRAPETDTLPMLFTELECRALIPRQDDLASVGLAPAVEPPPAGPRPPQLADPRIVADPADHPAMIEELRAARLVALETEPGLPGLAFPVAAWRSRYPPFGPPPRGAAFDAPPP